MTVRRRGSLVPGLLLCAGLLLAGCGASSSQDPAPGPRDSGVGGDTGAVADSGAAADSGVRADGGTASDTGPREDAGPVGGDGGSPGDSGDAPPDAQTDGGPSDPQDGGGGAGDSGHSEPVDAGPGADSGSPADAGDAPDDAGPLPGTLVTVTIPIGGPADALASYLMDAAAGEWNLFSGEQVPIGRREDPVSGTGVSYHTALRFPGVPVPAGAEIRQAVVSWFPTNEVDSSVSLMLSVWAEKAVDSAPFDPLNYEQGRPDQRLRTTALVQEKVIRCNRDCAGTGPEDCECQPVWDYGCWQRTLDCWDRAVRYDYPHSLAPLAQEVIDQPGWQAGNALTFLFVNVARDSEDYSRYRESRSITAWPAAAPDRRPQLTLSYVQP